MGDQAAAIVWDYDGEIVSWNPAAEALLGSAGEVIGRPVDLLIPGACTQRHWAGYDRVASGRLANAPTGTAGNDQ